MSDAADSLNVTQPTVTRSIKTIERIVGHPVVKRGRHGVTTTDVGLKLAAFGRDIFNSMVSADEALEQWKTGITGEIRLGMGSMISATALPGFFATRPLDGTNSSMTVVTATASTLVTKLRRGEIDIAVMPATEHQSKSSLLQIDLFDEQVCIIAGTQSPLAEINSVVSATLLEDQPWIAINPLTRGPHVDEDVVKAIGFDTIVPKFAFEGDTAAPVDFIRGTDMLAVLPCKLANTYVSGGGLKILDVDVELPYRKVAMWIAKENMHNPSTADMSEKIIAFFKNENSLH